MAIGAAHAQATAQKKVFRYAYEVAETGFDPAQSSDLYSRSITRNIFDAPLRFAYLAPPGTIEPNVAAELPTVSADFKTWTFKLKQGIYFTDDPAFKGKPRELTAQDFVYSYKRFYDPRWKSPAYGSFEQYDIIGMKALREEAMKTGKFDYDREDVGLRALDRYTLQIKFGKPQPRFANEVTDSSIMGAVAREVVEMYGDDIPSHPVGTSAYRLAEWRRSSSIALERNPNYREDYHTAEADPSDPIAQKIAADLKGKRLPFLDRIEIAIIEENQPRWLGFLNAEQDQIERVPNDLTQLALSNGKPTPIIEKKRIALQRRPFIDYAWVTYNMDHPTIGGYTPEKIALRRAINLALDAPEFIRSEYKGQAMIAQSNIMPMTYGYDPTLRTELGETDPARANAMLDAYGFVDRDGDGWRDMPDGSPLVLDISTQPEQRSRIRDEIWKKSMDRVRIKTTFNVAKWPEQLKKTREGKYMVWLLGLSAAGPDSGPTFLYAYGPAVGAQNLSRFRNAEFDKLYAEQDQMPDGPERLAHLHKMEKILIAYAPMNFILHRYVIYLWHPWVKNYRSWPFVSDWWRYVDIDESERSRAMK